MWMPSVSLKETQRAFELGSSECRSGRRAHRFEPAADVHLGVGLAAEMPGRRTVGGIQFPLVDCELLISALDYKPMDRALTNRPANLALKFLKTRHASSIDR